MWFRHLFDGKVGLYIQMLQNLDLNEIITTFLIRYTIIVKKLHILMIFHNSITSLVMYMNANLET